MGIFGGGGPKVDLAAEQEAAAARERERLARENAEFKANADMKALKKQSAAESRRKAFAGQLASLEGEDPSKRRYLQSA